MSNLQTIFNSKLTEVVHTTKKDGTNVYTASFEDGSNHVIRTSGRLYASVTQIKVARLDRSNGYIPIASSEFLFSAKPTPSLGKSERSRVIATVQVTNPPALQPVVEDTVITFNTHTSLYHVFKGNRFIGAYETMLEAGQIALLQQRGAK